MKSQHNLYADLVCATYTFPHHPYSLVPPVSQRYCNAMACRPQPLTSFSQHPPVLVIPSHIQLESLLASASCTCYILPFHSLDVLAHMCTLVSFTTPSDNPLHPLPCLFVSYLAPTHTSETPSCLFSGFLFSLIWFTVHFGMHVSHSASRMLVRVAGPSEMQEKAEIRPDFKASWNPTRATSTITSYIDTEITVQMPNPRKHPLSSQSVSMLSPSAPPSVRPCSPIALKNASTPKPASSGKPNCLTKPPNKPVLNALSRLTTACLNCGLDVISRRTSGEGGVGRSAGRWGKSVGIRVG